MRALLWLALRGTLSPALALAGLALLLVAARGAHANAAVEFTEPALAGARGLARQNVWSVLLILSPFLLLRAARLGRPAAQAWLTSAAGRARTPTLVMGLGCILAAGAASLATAVAAEVGTPGTETAWRRVRTAPSPAHVLTDGAPTLAWTLEDAPASGRLRLWTTVAPGAGPAVSARLSARSTLPAGREQETTARVSGRTALELDTPGAGTIAFELARIGRGALLVVPPDALEILAPVASERHAALTLGAHVWTLLAAGAVLAFGLGRVLRPSLAAGVVIALGLAATRGAASWSPTAGLTRAWDELSGGLVPCAPTAGSWLVASALLALGLALQLGTPPKSANATEGAP